MASVRVYPKSALIKALKPYKCRLLKELGGGLELWETGWGEPFTLSNEAEYYDEWQYRLLLNFISRTIPDDWFERNGY